MNLGFIIFTLTIFITLNTYYDGQLLESIKTKAKKFTKYYKMLFILFTGYVLWICVRDGKKFNNKSKLFQHASNFMKSMDVENSSTDFLSPLIELTNESSFFYPANIGALEQSTPQFKRMTRSGGGSGCNQKHKRSVGETKKKYVASLQNWKCQKCGEQLSAWFEVDHKLALEYGGTNEINNLVALCRNCHGEKTAMDRMKSDI